LEFTSFSVERDRTCNFDSVSVYDGENTGSPSLGKLCGELDNIRSSNFITSTGENMYITFHTDGLVGKTGFEAILSFIGSSDQPGG